MELDATSSNTIVSGDYERMPIAQFFEEVLDGRDYIFIQDKERRRVIVKAYPSTKDSRRSRSLANNIAGSGDKAQNQRPGDEQSWMSLESANEAHDDAKTPFQSYHLSRMGGIEELDNDLPIIESGNNKHIIDSQTALPWDSLNDDQTFVATEFRDYHPSQMGGINELDNNFSIVESGNDKHIIDSQTGLPWSMVDELK
jgi:hypothetical protein